MSSFSLTGRRQLDPLMKDWTEFMFVSELSRIGYKGDLEITTLAACYKGIWVTGELKVLPIGSETPMEVGGENGGTYLFISCISCESTC